VLKWIEHKSILAVGCSNGSKLLPALDPIAFHKTDEIMKRHVEVAMIRQVAISIKQPGLSGLIYWLFA
jgi:hypothetical protein